MNTPSVDRIRAFSLVELLVVVAIIVALASLIVPSFSSLGKASNLTNSASIIVDQFNVARQTALAQNRTVEVRFYLLNDAIGNSMAYRAVRAFLQDESGVKNAARPLSNLKQLPTGIVALSDEKYSTLLAESTRPQNPEDKEALTNVKEETMYKSVKFRPTGGTDLDPNGAPGGDKWFLTLKAETDPEVGDRPAANFITLQLDPVSGRSRQFRP